MSGTSELNSFNERLIAEYRANAGRVTGQFAGAPLLLLTTTGAKSGRARTMPLVYSRDGNHLVIIASKGGAPTNPDWYHNLVANPEVTVELGEETFRARASVPGEPERTRLYDQQSAFMPGFVEYQKKTTRRIPVVVLERLG